MAHQQMGPVLGGIRLRQGYWQEQNDRAIISIIQQEV